MLDLGTMRLSVDIDGDVSVTLPIDTPDGRRQVEDIFGELGGARDVLPRLVRGRGGHFMDKPDNVLSLINLATVRDLEKRWGTSLDPLRFRAFDWIGQDLVVGDAVLSADRRNGRCGATNVDPRTGERDRDVPAALRASFGHKDLGIYLLAKTGGKVVLGDTVSLSGMIEPQAHDAPSRGKAQPSARFICRGCPYVFAEDQRGSDGSRPGGAAFADLPPDWTCPDCGTDKGKLRPYRDLAEADAARRRDRCEARAGGRAVPLACGSSATSQRWTSNAGLGRQDLSATTV